VVTVAALNPDLSSAEFSNENEAIDVSAPGSAYWQRCPTPSTTMGVQDGYEAASSAVSMCWSPDLVVSKGRRLLSFPS
jgi:hypothetical protein